MTIHRQRFDRVLPGLFDELAETRTPDYLEAAIQHASARPQRPAWTYPGRWLPVQITTQAVSPARMPWRQLGILALVGILLALAIVAYVGSRRAPSPAPYFGLASNGQIAVEREGDIVAVDQATGEITPIVTGPELDSAPVHTRDGTRIAFERRATTAGEPPVIMVASADGSGLVRATPEPLSRLTQWTLSPDGRDVLVVTESTGLPVIEVFAVDGSRDPVPLDIGLAADLVQVDVASYRPPDGRELLVVARLFGVPTRGLYVVDAASGALLRTLVEPSADVDVYNADWSPSGDTVSYGAFDPAGDGLRFRLHLVSADATGSHQFEAGRDVAYDGALSAWSNDGMRMIRVRGESSDGAGEEMLLESVNGDATPVAMACGPSGPAACPDGWLWSPDDTVLLGVVNADDGSTRYVFADPATGAITPATWTGTGLPDWQRTAP